MKDYITTKTKWQMAAALVVLLLWQGLSMIYPSIVVPSIREVLAAVTDIVTSRELLGEILITLQRLVIALSISISVGMVLGLWGGCSSKRKAFLMPLINIIQSIPPISWLVLALIWFGLNGKASIFITIVSTIPFIIINLMEGIRNIDQNLIEMGRMYGFSKRRMLQKIILPSILPYFEAGLKLALGSGCKVIVMGEVLSGSDGIGGQLTNARLNIETEYIFAWTIMIVLVFYLSNRVVTYLLEKGLKGERYAYRTSEFN